WAGPRGRWPGRWIKEPRRAVRSESSTGGFGNVVRALSIRNYRVYTLGNAISLIGIWLQRVTVGWLAWQLTHSGTWLGLVAVADLAPVVFLSPMAGGAAPRRRRRLGVR